LAARLICNTAETQQQKQRKDKVTIYHFYSAAGGQGCTVAACVFALGNDKKTLLYDRAGDARAALGLMAAPDRVTDINEMLDIYDGDIQPDYDGYDDVVIDWGKQATTEFGPGVMVLVTKPCYLALRRAVGLCNQPTSNAGKRVVMFQDNESRALRDRDVEATLGMPVAYIMRQDPAIARVVDAGLLSARMPTQLANLNACVKDSVTPAIRQIDIDKSVKEYYER
jgi:hypothetical protein